MGAQPRPKIGVASLASGDLPSRAVVILTRTFCSLLWDVVCKLSFAFFVAAFYSYVPGFSLLQEAD